MTFLGVIAAGIAYGVASALIPVLNAEVYVAANAVLLSTPRTWVMVLTVSLGTVIGKVIIFRAARVGRDVVKRRPPKPRPEPRPEPGRFRRGLKKVSDLLLAWLSDPVGGVVTVVVSGFIGIPPLIVVSAAAGVSTMGTVRFAVAVLIGRAGHFGVFAAAALGIT